MESMSVGVPTLWATCRSATQGDEDTVILKGRSGVIGRADCSDLVLPDPERFISRRHLDIEYENSGFVAIDRSQDGTYLNGTLLSNDEKRPLEDGDELVIGNYTVSIRIAAAETPHLSSDVEDKWWLQAAPDRAEKSSADVKEKWWENTPGQHDSVAAKSSGVLPARVESKEDHDIRSPVSDGASTADLELFNSFLDAAGIDIAELKQNVNQNFATEMGQVFKEALQGLYGLAQARAAFKDMWEVEKTIMQAADNNPLKINKSYQSAQETLFGGETGYLEPLRAVREVVVDLGLHETAFSLAIEQSLLALIDSLSPEELEQRFADWHDDSGAPIFVSKDATNWRNYCAHIEKLKAEFAEDKSSLRMLFARAYQQQQQQLQSTSQ